MAGKVTLRDQLLFPSEFVSAVELKGRDVVLTIATVTMQELKLRGGASKRKPVLTFNGTKKKLVLNVTNADSIASMYGTKAESWVGKKIAVYPTKTKMGRETVGCIRIREVKQKGAVTDVPFDDPEPRAEEDLVDDVFTHPTDENLTIDTSDASEGAGPALDDVPGQIIPPKENYTRWPRFAEAMQQIAIDNNVPPSQHAHAMDVLKMTPASKWPGIVEAAKAGGFDWSKGEVVG